MRNVRHRALRAIVIAISLASLLAPTARADSDVRSRLVTLELSSPPCIGLGGVPPLPVNVLLPEGYNGSNRFPVLYLLHGLGGNYKSWLDGSSGKFEKVVEDLPAIVVMPEAGIHPFYANSWNHGFRSPCWEDYFLRQLIPEIEARFLVLPGRRWHAIGGFSSGGLGAALYGARLPGYFGQVLSFSGVVSIQRPELVLAAPLVQAMWAPTTLVTHGVTPLHDAFGDPDRQRFYWMGHNPPVIASALAHSRLYVAHGGPTAPTCVDVEWNHKCAVQEVGLGLMEGSMMRQLSLDLVRAARLAGADVTYRPQTGGHWYGYASRFLDDAITNWGLFEPVPEAATSWSYLTVSRTGNVWGLDFTFDKRPSDGRDFHPERPPAFGSGHGHGSLQRR